MQAVGPALGIAGQAVGTIGNVMNADIMAKMQDVQSRTIRENAEFDERQFRRKAKIQAGENVATAAATGLDITKGSPLFAELDFAKQSEIEAQSIRRSGTIAADQKKFESRMTRRQIPFDIMGGVLGAGSILTRLAGK